MTGSDRYALNLSEISIDRDGEVPIGVQLAWFLRARIHDGGLRPGDRLPGLRELAEATGVNINTVKAVYQRLHNEGLIDSQQGSGTYVGSTRPSGSAARIAVSAAQTAQECGVDPREVAAVLYVSPPQGPGSPDESSSIRRNLRSQIAVFERAFGELDSAHPGLLPPPTTAYRSPGPRLLSAAELELARSHLLRRLLSLQQAIDDQDRAEEAALTPAKSTGRASSRKSTRQASAKPPSRLPSRPATAEG